MKNIKYLLLKNKQERWILIYQVETMVLLLLLQFKYEYYDIVKFIVSINM